MKDFKKTFKVVITTVIIFALLYTSVLTVVKSILISKIEKATGLKTTIRSLDIRPPFGIQVRGFELAGVIKADRIFIGLSIRSLLFGKVAFNKILIGSPEFTYQRNPVAPAPQQPVSEPIVVETESQGPAVVEHPSPESSGQNKVFPVSIRKLKIYSGKLHFIDNTASSGKITVLVKDLNFYVTNLSTVPTKRVSKFNLSSNLSWDTGEPDGKMDISGWVNLNKKDIQAKIKIMDIDAIVFYPYYSTWVDLEKAKIKKAKLNFTCDINGEDNDVVADCHLELADMVRSARGIDEPKQKAERITDAVLDMFKTMDHGNIALDFKLRTKMDRPDFGFANVKAAFEEKLAQARANAGMRPQDMLSLPVHWFRKGVKTGTDLSNAVIDGVFDLSNGVKKFFEERMDRTAPVQGG